MSSSQRALVINNRSCPGATLGRKVAAHKVLRKAGNVGFETARTEDWQLEPQSQPCYVNLPSEAFHVPPAALCTQCLRLPPGAPPPQDSGSCDARLSVAPGLKQH